MRLSALILIILLGGCTGQHRSHSRSGPIYRYNGNLQSRWSSSENRNGIKGACGKENNGAKGHPADIIPAGGTIALLDVQNQGIINRIWLTINDRSPQMLRSLKLEMYWDNEAKPAVSVPLSDFFGMQLGITSAFENEFFASPEGRSFNCFIPMPFKKAARIQITNESDKQLAYIFFDVDYSLVKKWNNDFMYFHASWNRDTATTPGKDFELLPRVNGHGRLLGVNVGVNANSVYRKSWWGEGEVKMFIDNDDAYPTLVGTGTEDYIGTAWGQAVFANRYTGCLIADQANEQWSFYRYHVPDPVYFSSGIKVTLQQIGGNGKTVVEDMQAKNVRLIPISIDDMENAGKFYHLYEKEKIADLKASGFPDKWTNFYRSDDVSATAYFYLNSPSDNLRPLAPVGIRTANLRIPLK